MIETEAREKAILVGVVPKGSREAGADDNLDELALLADSAGAVVIHRIRQERQNIDAAFFLGKGKAEELSWLVKEKAIDIVIFDDDLSAVQVRNLERIIKCKIVDRSGLILDIFASRAQTKEAKTQVELAQLKYMLPRLTRQWTHLSKQFGGIGTKGPGETQIETDRRAVRQKIGRLNARLETIAKERAVQKKGREKFPRLALVGYTNAGKSTLLNYFADAAVKVEDRLFATLDPTVRIVSLSPLHTILLSDTVGFIRKLPHNLIAAFKGTLEEVLEADLLLHVVDVSHPMFEEHIAVVDETLGEIGASGKRTVLVFNKVDRVQDRRIVAGRAERYDHAVSISATRGINLSALRDTIITVLDENIADRTMTFKQQEYQIISQIHDMAEVLEKHYGDGTVTIRFRMNKVHAGRLQKMLAARPGTRRR